MNPPHRGHQATWGGFYSRNGQTCSSLTGRTSGLPHQLERRWNEKLQEIESTQQRLSSLEENRSTLSSEEEERIRWMGESFTDVWQSDRCPPALKKMIFRTVIEEIVV